MARRAVEPVVVALARVPTRRTTVVRLVASAVALSVCIVVPGGPVFWTALIASVVWAGFAAWLHLRGATPVNVELDDDGISLPSRLSSTRDRIAWRDVRFALLQQVEQKQVAQQQVAQPQGEPQQGQRGGMFRLVVDGRLAGRLLQSTDFPDLESFGRVHAFARARIGSERFRDLPARAWCMPWVTLAVMAAIAASFLIGRFGLELPASIEALYLGAYQAQLFEGGDWFRANSFSMAHLHALHFALNLFLVVAVCAELEQRIGRMFVAGLIGLSSLGAGSAIALLPTQHDITLGASGICYGAIGALLLLTWRAPELAPPSFRRVPMWWLSLLLVVDVVHGIASPDLSLAGHLGGLVGGVALTLAYVRSRRVDSVALQQGVGALSLAAAAFFVACLVGLLHAGLTTSPRELAERLLAADIAADTALDVANYVSKDAAVASAVLQRAFAVLSDPERPGIEKVTDGAYGVLREDTLGRLAWRLDMLGEARAHGLDAVRRSEGVSATERQRLLARFAVYESSARLPPFVPAAVLVRAGTLCVLVPNGNPRQYLRAVARNGERVVGVVLGTVDPGETRCIPASGVSSSTRVALTAAERALLTSDLVFHPVDVRAAALLPRGGA